MMLLDQKIEESIKIIKDAEPLALKYQDFGFHVAFSGGKDSQVILELCKMAEIKGYSVYFYGAKPTVAKRASDKIQIIYPKKSMQDLQMKLKSSSDSSEFSNLI